MTGVLVCSRYHTATLGQGLPCRWPLTTARAAMRTHLGNDMRARPYRELSVYSNPSTNPLIKVGLAADMPRAALPAGSSGA